LLAILSLAELNLYTQDLVPDIAYFSAERGR